MKFNLISRLILSTPCVGTVVRRYEIEVPSYDIFTSKLMLFRKNSDVIVALQNDRRDQDAYLLMTFLL